MGSRYTDPAGNRLWQDYSDTPTYTPGMEIARLDVAQGDSQRIVVRPINDFATPGAQATGQWSLDGQRWDPCPYYDPAIGTYTASGVFNLGANKPLIFADIGNYFRIIANTAGGYASPSVPNLVAGMTGDDGIIFGGSGGGGGGGGGGGPVTAADGALVTIGTTTDAATASGANTTAIGALRAIRDKLLGSIAVTGTFFQAKQPVSAADGDLATIGTTGDAATASGASSTVVGALRAIRDKLLGTLTTVISAGTAIIGKVGIDTAANLIRTYVTTATKIQSSITAGGTAQAFSTAKARNGYSFQNTSSADLFFNELAASATDCSATNFTQKVPAGGYFYSDPWFVSQGIIAVFGATTGQTYTGKEG